VSWRTEVPADFASETGKIRFDAQRYCHGVGLDVGCGPWEVFPAATDLNGTPHAARRRSRSEFVFFVTSAVGVKQNIVMPG
jgi:hypothetical protein